MESKGVYGEIGDSLDGSFRFSRLTRYVDEITGMLRRIV